MRRLLLFPIILTALALPSPASAEKKKVVAPKVFAHLWALPHSVTSANTKISFKVDSSFHLVEGEVSDISGAISLADPHNLKSIQIKLSIASNSLRTGDDSRDDDLKEAFQAEKFPQISVEGVTLQPGCDPDQAEGAFGCDTKIKAKLSVMNITKEIDVPFTIKRSGDNYQLSGHLSFKREDFGLDDPGSILNSWDKTIHIKYLATIPVIEGAK